MSGLLQNWASAYTDGALAPAHFHNGLPFEADGSLAVQISGAVDHHHQGLPFTAVGRLAISPTGPVDHTGSGCSAFNATGQLLCYTENNNDVVVHGVIYYEQRALLASTYP